MARNYYRVMCDKGSKYASECHDGGFIGGDWGVRVDLQRILADKDRFKELVSPKIQAGKPNGKVDRECGALYTICRGIKKGDIVLSPDGKGQYFIGEVTRDYWYEKKSMILPHRRAVNWLKTIDRKNASSLLRTSASSPGACISISKHEEEIESLLESRTPVELTSPEESAENIASFALESQLEDFLVHNWQQARLGDHYDIVGQQYRCDTGRRIDILAINKDKKEYLVIELKRGRATDVVMGQLLSYMGFVSEVLATRDQKVRGAIIAPEDDGQLRRAVNLVDAVDFYRYEVSFELLKD